MKKRILKSVLALVIMVAMLVPCLPAVVLAADENVAVTPTRWNESLTADDAYTWLKANCDADNDGVYVLDDFTDLAYFMACGRGTTPKSFEGNTIKLGASIVWNDGVMKNGVFTPAKNVTTVYQWESYACKSSSYSYDFKGVFDGNGKTITGLYISQNGGNVGFIGRFRNTAKIQNLTFSNAYVESTAESDACVGIAVGAFYQAKGTISNVTANNCYVTSKSSASVGGGVGALCGAPGYTNATISLENCVVDQDTVVVGITNVGGFVGSDQYNGGGTTTKIKNCVCYASLESKENTVAAFIGKATYTVSIENATFFGRITMGEFSTVSKIYQNGATATKLEMDDADNDVMTIEGVQVRTNQTNNAKFDARFIASIDFDAIDPALTKKDFKQFGFEIAEIGQFANKTASAVQNGVVETVYTSIESSFGSVEIRGLRADQSDVDYVIDADYLATVKIEEIPAAGIQTVLVRSYYVTKTSDVPVYGGYVAVTFANGRVVGSTCISSIEQENKIALACSFDTQTYDVATLFAGSTVTVAKNGEAQSGTTVALDSGVNDFELSVVKNGIEFVYDVSIARRAGHLVVFNANGGKNGCSMTVADGTKITPPTPTRANHTFAGWTTDGITVFNFNTPITSDMTFIAKWTKNSTTTYASQTLGYGAPKFEGINAGLHVVWKDYADAFGYRPQSVTCVLTQTYGNTTKSYNITLKKDSVAWAGDALSGVSLMQGDGGSWTLSLKNLPETVSGVACTYTLKQQSLSGNYTSMQSGSSAVNTINGYVPSMDETAKLTAQNGRLYDAAGNMIVFTGVVSANLNWAANLANTTSTVALSQLSEKGCNALRVSIPIVASGDMYYVYQAKNGNFRTGDYNDDISKKATEAQKQEVIDATCAVIDRATEAGIYVIVDWTILTSNPNDYLNYAIDFFNRISKLYPDNPYVLYELCNEPAGCAWSGENGIREYAEKLIPEIRKNNPDAVCIVAPRGASNYISMSPVAYNRAGDSAGDDPITDPVNAYNVAYTQHPYAYENAYADSNGRNSFGWRIRDAYEAGLTIICTEMSPMAADLTDSDPLGYDFNAMNKYMRMFQEYDISYCYFKSYTETAYTEWCMFLPNVNPSAKTWTRADLTVCGQWYYDLITGDGIFITGVDYDAQMVKTVRDSYKNTFSSYGLGAVEGGNFFTPFPTFAVSGSKSGSTYFFKVGDSDTLNDIQYQAYCQSLFDQLTKVGSNVSGTVPTTKTQAMTLTYSYNSVSRTISVSYAQQGGNWGIVFRVQ